MIRDKVRHTDRADEKKTSELQKKVEADRVRERQRGVRLKLMGRFEGNGLWIPYGLMLVPL